MRIQKLLIGTLMVVCGPQAYAAVSCIDNPTDFQLALDSAAASAEPDEIRLVATTLTLPLKGIEYESLLGQPRDLLVVGGWEPGCKQRLKGGKTSLDASAVVIDAGFKARADNSSLSFSHLVMTAMPDNGALFQSNAMYLESSGGVIVVDANAFILNQGYQGSALLVKAPNGHIHLADNIVAGNGSRSSAVSIGANAAHCRVINNTVANNSSTGSNGGISVGNCQTAFVANNIFWGNEGYDVNLFANDFPGSPYDLRNNDIALAYIDPSVALSESGRMDVHPMYGPGLFNYAPQRQSPVVNAGWEETSLELNALDYFDNPRIDDHRVDLGAIEYVATLFRNGFED